MSESILILLCTILGAAPTAETILLDLEIEEENEKMESERLKTLKDIGLKTCILKNDLKQEAIKWWFNKDGCMDRFDWIKFFNITEEDLK